METVLGKPVTLVITDNSTSMISAKIRKDNLFLRLNKIFLDADTNVLEEIANFIKNRKVKTPLIREFVKANRDRLKKKPPKRVSIKTKGKYHDLHEIYNSINTEYFDNTISSTITWGVQNNRRIVRKRRLGSFNRYTNTIRINPVLDKRTVPRYFIEYVVYHEMLHADICIIKGKNNRCSAHSKEFKERERLFKNYERVLLWERKKFC